MNWKRVFNFRQSEVLGLDIGSSAVKIVRLHKGEAGYSVTSGGIAEIAAGDDNNHKKINTIKAIRQCLQLAGVKTRLAVCGVSGPEVAVRDFEFPSLPAADVESAVLLEASQVCPFNAADIAVDYQLIPNADVRHMSAGESNGNGDDKTRGVLIAATKTLINNKVRLAEKANLKCVLVDVDGLALLNCFKGVANGQKSQTDGTIAILNVGGSHTTLAIMSDDGLPFIRDMTYAGDDIVKQIATENDMSAEAVKGILFVDSSLRSHVPKQDSITGQTESEGTDCEPPVLEKACQKLIADVAETLRYYTAQTKSTDVKKILVCGGFALAKGFVELLNNQLGAEAILWNPFDTMRCDADQQSKDIFEIVGPAMTVAAGLAMRSV